MSTVIIYGTDGAGAKAAEAELREAGHDVYGMETMPYALAEKEIAALRDRLEAVDVIIFSPTRNTADDEPVGSAAGADPGDSGKSTAAGRDYGALMDCIEDNVMNFRTLVETFVPLMKESSLKRIAVLTDPGVSIRRTKDTQDFGWHMSAAAVNMAHKIYFNRLRPEGFTFRTYAAGHEEGGITAAQYIMGGLSQNPPEEPIMHSDENRFRMRDGLYDEIPW